MNLGAWMGGVVGGFPGQGASPPGPSCEIGVSWQVVFASCIQMHKDHDCDGALPQTPPTGSRWIAAPGSGVDQMIQKVR